MEGPGVPQALPKVPLGPSPQKTQKAPLVVVTTGAVKGDSGAPKSLNPNTPQKAPLVVVTTEGAQEVKQGGLQAPHKTKNATSSDLQAQFSAVVGRI